MRDCQVPWLLYCLRDAMLKGIMTSYLTTYEIIISMTMALVLLPFNFWFAAVLALLAGLIATALELRA